MLQADLTSQLTYNHTASSDFNMLLLKNMGMFGGCLSSREELQQATNL
jgi:hypothetical protein